MICCSNLSSSVLYSQSDSFYSRMSQYSKGKKKQRSEATTPFFIADLTIVQLQQALSQRGIDTSTLPRKKQLIERLEQVVACEDSASRAVRMASAQLQASEFESK